MVFNQGDIILLEKKYYYVGMYLMGGRYNGQNIRHYLPVTWHDIYREYMLSGEPREIADNDPILLQATLVVPERWKMGEIRKGSITEEMRAVEGKKFTDENGIERDVQSTRPTLRALNLRSTAEHIASYLEPRRGGKKTKRRHFCYRRRYKKSKRQRTK